MRDSIPILLLLAGCTIPLPDDASLDASGAATEPESDEEGSTQNGEGGSEASTGPSTSQGSESGESDPDTSAGPESSGGSDSGDPPTCGGAPGTIYVQREYEVEDPEELFVEPVASATYIEGDCFEGSNCWQINPNGDNGNEDHAGWGTVDLPRLAEGGTRSMFVGHLLYVSSGMIDMMVNEHVGGKMLDVYQHDLPDGGGATRQTVIWGMHIPDNPGPDWVDTSATGVVPQLFKGGAGGSYVRQLGPVQFDLRNYADQWIWLEVEFNAAERYTALWVKTADGVFDGCEPLMLRSADNPEDWLYDYGYVEEPYEYVDEAWQTPGLAWGYWDDLENKPWDAEDFVRLDHMIVSDAFIDPPF